MPIDAPSVPPALFSTAPTANWVNPVELARVSENGEVFVDWVAVRKATMTLEPQLRHMAELLMAVRNHKDKPLEHDK